MLRLCSTFAARMAAFASAQHVTLSDIMLRQDFQDLSGQVIGKAIALIEHAEGRLGEVIGSLSPATTTPPSEPADSVLAGPQVPGRALKQDDVDDLLASLGF